MSATYYLSLIENEGDHKEFDHGGLKCVMHRHPSLKHWCGYVGVASDHPWFGKDYGADVPFPKEMLESTEERKNSPFDFLLGGRNIEHGLMQISLYLNVHGGITWANDKAPECKTKGLWWFGFDCAHCDDWAPHRNDWRGEPDDDAQYRDAEYVEAECRSLAEQLSQIAEPTSADSQGEM